MFRFLHRVIELTSPRSFISSCRSDRHLFDPNQAICLTFKPDAILKQKNGKIASFEMNLKQNKALVQISLFFQNQNGL